MTKKYYYKNKIVKGTLCLSVPIKYCVGIPKNKIADYEEITQEEYEKIKKSQ